jgi:hypothetical protein
MNMFLGNQFPSAENIVCDRCLGNLKELKQLLKAVRIGKDAEEALGYKPEYVCNRCFEAIDRELKHWKARATKTGR